MLGGDGDAQSPTDDNLIANTAKIDFLCNLTCCYKTNMYSCDVCIRDKANDSVIEYCFLYWSIQFTIDAIFSKLGWEGYMYTL